MEKSTDLIEEILGEEEISQELRRLEGSKASVKVWGLFFVRDVQ